MKKRGIFMLIIACMAGTGASAQRVTLSGKGLSLEQVFEQIKAQTGYDFVYNQDDIDHAKKVDLNVKNAPLKDVLDQCLRRQGFTYEILNKIIGVRGPVRKKPSPNHITITGMIVDTAAGNSPLADASIQVEGEQTAARSGRNGYFALEDIGPRATLLISYVGYRSQRMTVGDGDQFLYIPLEPGDNRLDEVQTIAYGKVSSRLNTGNVTTVKGTDLTITPAGNPLLALQGLVPGLMITQLTGAPGGGFSVQLRGQSSIESESGPLYVIDGIPYVLRPAGVLFRAFNANLAGGNMLNLINPADIESIDVLKDADATAIYGSQGASGVILITTNKGRQGPARFTIDASSGLGAATRTPHYLGLSEYLAMRHEALQNDQVTVNARDYDLNGAWDTTRYTNWSKLLMGHMVRTNDFQLQFTGGNKNIQYFAGTGFHDESTVYPGNGGDRKGSVHLNLNAATPDRKLDLRITGSWTSGVNTVQPADVTALTATAADAPPAYKPNDSLNWQNHTFSNPLGHLTDQYKNHAYTVITSALLTFHLGRGLDLKANVGYNVLNNREFFGTPAISNDPWLFAYLDPTSMRHAIFVHDNSRSWIAEPQASFTGPLAQGVLTALAGASYRHSTDKLSGATGSTFPSDAALSDLSKATTVNSIPEQSDDYKYNALFGRLSYNWKNKYLASFNGRYDGSSRFGPDRQFHFFGSLAGAWIFSAERFFQRRLGWLSFGKLRGSYGTTGNDGIPSFLARGAYDSVGLYRGAYGLSPGTLANPEISWESTRKMEIGLDLGFAKDRFLLNINYYRFRSSNLLTSSYLSTVTGFNGVIENLPVVVGNQGIELSLQTTNIKSAHLLWTTSATLTIPHNKLIRFDNIGQAPAQGLVNVGDPVNILRVFRSGGVDPQTGLYRFIDSSGKYTSQPNYLSDLTAIVRLDPTLYGSIANRLRYKSITLEVLIYFIRQVNINPDLATHFPPGFKGANILVETAKSHWRYPGETAAKQRYGVGNGSVISNFYAGLSDLRYSNAAYIRCKNIYLAYQFPATLTKKFHMNDLTCYLKGQNLFTISGYKDYDPETGIHIAPIRLLAAGIKAGF